MKYPYGKRALVTGGTSGIGGAIAHLLASNGYHVYACSRSSEERIETVGEGTIEYLKMDVRDINSVRKGIASISPETAIVIHAAGFGISGAAEDTPIYAAREQMETNYFGVLTVNQEVLPILRTHEKSLVVAISSIGGKVPLPYQSHYASSKYALEAYMQALRMEAKAFGVRAVLIEPGDTRTGFTGKREHVIPKDSPYRKAYERALAQIEHDELNGTGPENAAKAVLRCASTLNPPVRIAIGFGYKALMLLLRFLPDSWALFIISKLYHC